MILASEQQIATNSKTPSHIGERKSFPSCWTSVKVYTMNDPGYWWIVKIEVLVVCVPLTMMYAGA